MLLRRVMVRYRLKPDRAGENRRLIMAVFSELKQSSPDGIRYATFSQPDGLSFVHFASIETAGGSNPLAAVAAFKTFGADIKDRCEEPPVVVDLTEVGSYRFFD